MAEQEPEPQAEQPANASTLLTVSWRAWRLFGRDWGPVRTAVLRLALVTGGPPIIERVDGRPLGAIAERCREPIEQALHELRERTRQRRLTSRTSRQLREQSAPTPAGGPASAALEPRAPEGPAPSARTTTGIFRCDREAITDRIDRLKRAVRPPEAKPDPRTDAITRLAAMRALQAASRPEDGTVTPFGGNPVAPETTGPPEKRSSSVFRCDREVITDRITKLKRKDGAPTEGPG